MEDQKKIIDQLNNELDHVILCPSRSRASQVLTTRLVNDLVLVVNADQRDEYRECNPNNIVLSPPDNIRGITPTRSWMLENFINIFMVDDDVVQVRRNYVEKGEDGNITDPNEVSEIIDYSFYVARLLGAKMFGFPSTRNPLEYNSHAPFGFTGYYNNSHVGFLEGHGLRYSNEFGEAEDYYISLMQAHKNRYGFFDRRFTFITKENFVGTGGCCEYRTTEMMMDNTLRLRQLFGEAVKVKHPSHTKGHVHAGERSISIPF